MSLRTLQPSPSIIYNYRVRLLLKQEKNINTDTDSKHIVYLSLGTNLGDRSAHLQTAIEALSTKLDVVEISPVYETEPWGYSDQPQFLNQVVKCQTKLDPEALFGFIKQLEIDLGREKTFRFGPRVIDIDLLFIDELILDTPNLTVPHDGIPDRAFVLVPLADLAPEFKHPVIGLTVEEMLAQVDTSGVALFSQA